MTCGGLFGTCGKGEFLRGQQAVNTGLVGTLPLVGDGALLLRAAQAGEHVEVFQRRGVALDLCAGGNLLEQAAHDFSGARLGQRFGEADVVGLGHRADFLADMLAKLTQSED